MLTIPLRYGLNIQGWSWQRRTSARDYCYGADALAVGGTEAEPITFFAFEWANPRLGKVIREVRLKATAGFRGASRAAGVCNVLYAVRDVFADGVGGEAGTLVEDG